MSLNVSPSMISGLHDLGTSLNYARGPRPLPGRPHLGAREAYEAVTGTDMPDDDDDDTEVRLPLSRAAISSPGAG